MSPLSGCGGSRTRETRWFLGPCLLQAHPCGRTDALVLSLLAQRVRGARTPTVTSTRSTTHFLPCTRSYSRALKSALRVSLSPRLMAFQSSAVLRAGGMAAAAREAACTLAIKFPPPFCRRYAAPHWTFQRAGRRRRLFVLCSRAEQNKVARIRHATDSTRE